MKKPNLNFIHTIRFRLSLFYSVIIFVFCSVFILVLNIYFNIYFTRPLHQNQNNDAEKDQFEQLLFPTIEDRFEDLVGEQRQAVEALRRQDLQNVQLASLLSLIPISIFSLGVGYLVSGYFLAPLNDLNKKISKMSSGNLSQHIDYEGPNDEVGKLIHNFNEMSKRVHNEFTKQVEFVQDAAHELKTPLAVIYSNTEVVAAGITPNPAAAKSIKNVTTGITRLNSLIDDLLVLSEPTGLFEKTDLNELMQDLTDDLQHIAAEKEVKLVFQPTKKPLEVAAQPHNLGRAMRNIIENAIKYSSGHAKAPQVTVTLSHNGKKALIEVTDNGPGIPKSEQKRIFERFYRLDKSRATTSGGSGLGLSIAQKIIHEHKGEISLESKPGKTTFVVEV